MSEHYEPTPYLPQKKDIKDFDSFKKSLFHTLSEIEMQRFAINFKDQIKRHPTREEAIEMKDIVMSALAANFCEKEDDSLFSARGWLFKEKFSDSFYKFIKSNDHDDRYKNALAEIQKVRGATKFYEINEIRKFFLDEISACMGKDNGDFDILKNASGDSASTSFESVCTSYFDYKSGRESKEFFEKTKNDFMNCNKKKFNNYEEYANHIKNEEECFSNEYAGKLKSINLNAMNGVMNNFHNKNIDNGFLTAEENRPQLSIFDKTSNSQKNQNNINMNA